MSKKIFLAISFENKAEFEKEITAVKNVIADKGYSLTFFVEEYIFEKGQERAMMKAACEALENADILIAEVSNKAIGVGIEVGFAAALKKPVIYLKRKSAEYSITVGGLAQHQVNYETPEDLQIQLMALFD